MLLLCYRACFHSLVLGLGDYLGPSYSTPQKPKYFCTEWPFYHLSCFLVTAQLHEYVDMATLRRLLAFLLLHPQRAQALCVCQSQCAGGPSSAGSASMLSSHLDSLSRVLAAELRGWVTRFALLQSWALQLQDPGCCFFGFCPACHSFWMQ